jgi:hypothetical protein
MSSYRHRWSLAQLGFRPIEDLEALLKREVVEMTPRGLSPRI